MKKMPVVIFCIFFLISGSTFAEVWMDDFEDGELEADWTPAIWFVAPANWSVEDGILKGKWPKWSAQCLFLEEYHSLDYTMQVKCRIDKIWQSPGLADAGFAFRSSGPPGGKNMSLYGFGIGASRAQFFIMQGPDWQYRGTTPQSYNTGQWYTLKLIVQGDRFLGYVNDRPVCKLEDRALKGKFVGLGMGSNISASFDDFMITDQVDEDAILNFDVSPEGMLTTTWAGLKAQ